MDEAVAVGQAVGSSVCICVGENLKETVSAVMSGRDNVVMVRINEESLARLDELVESGIVKSRSEAAAFLIGEGIKSRLGLFDRIAEKTEEIRRAREELRQMLDEG
jgi:Arc/MetJ-type ribon-helix-helix transcriptional regulator